MKVALQHINALPMRTWRWLGVNDTSLEQEIPDISPYDGALPALPAGLAALSAIPPMVEQIETAIGPEMQEFMAKHANINVALQVPAGTQIEEPLIYSFMLDKQNPALVDDHVIVAEENSRLTVVQLFSSGDETEGFHAGSTRIYAHKNAQVKIVRIQMFNAGTTHLNDLGIHAEEGAQLEVVDLEMGGSNALAGCKCRLDGRKARIDINVGYLGNGSRKLDLNYVVDHIARETTSEVQSGGALFGNSEKIFRGTIDFKKGAARSIGHEQENTLLFSPTCRTRSAPLILTGEENVEGQHAATIGKIDAAKLFYITSRGLTETQAKQLMVEALFAPMLSKLADESMREEIRQVLSERMTNA